MDYLGIAIVAVLMLILIIAFLVEIYVVRQHNARVEEWTELVDEYIDAFNEMRTALNGNANILRLAGETINAHDRTLKIMTVMLDIHSEVLKIKKGLRDDLSKQAIEGFVMDIKDNE
jgi:sugar-specific transcriptional regulator TrmB